MVEEWAAWLKSAGYPFDFLTETPPPKPVVTALARLWYIEEQAAHPNEEWRDYYAFILDEIYGDAQEDSNER